MIGVFLALNAGVLIISAFIVNSMHIAALKDINDFITDVCVNLNNNTLEQSWFSIIKTNFVYKKSTDFYQYFFYETGKDYYNPFLLASSQNKSISANVISFRLRPFCNVSCSR